MLMTDSRPLHAHVDIKSYNIKSVSSYYSHLKHSQCLQSISDQFDVILMDKKIGFYFINFFNRSQTFELYSKLFQMKL